jgi:hypothetical protein
MRGWNDVLRAVVRNGGSEPAGSNGDDSMSKPLVASVSHGLGRRKARQRIESSLHEIRAHLMAFATSVEEQWTEDRLDFRLIALGQAISGSIDVFEDFVRIEVMLPGMLSVLRGKISTRIREHGLKLLETK